MSATHVAARGATAPPGHAPASGFIIVGVVVFVLALTILGLSLFGLSSFEAQFMGRTIREAQAVNFALGGLARAKNVLRARDSLGAVKLLEGNGNIVYARARYADDHEDSLSANIDWSGSRNLEIRVAAEVGGQRSMVEVQVTPSRPAGFYTNLITSYTGVTVVEWTDTPDTVVVHTQTFMDGSVWQNSGDETWNALAQTTYGRTVTKDGVPFPDAAGYLSVWQGAPTAPATGNGSKYTLTAQPDSFQHFIGPSVPGSGFGLRNTFVNDAEVHVSGTAVWMLPGGAYFDQQLYVRGTPSDRLIIVATKGTATSGFGGLYGLHFAGGLDSPDGVPIILVSDGTIALNQLNDYPNAHYLPWLSVFANNVAIKGPGIPGALPENQPISTYRHVDGIPYDDSDVLDELIEWGILPNVTGGISAQYELVRGSWREVTESSPN